MINKVFGFLLLFTLIQTAAVAQSQFEERDIARQVTDSAVTFTEPCFCGRDFKVYCVSY